MDWLLKSPKMSSSGHPLVLTVSQNLITSSVILRGVQCERLRRFPVRRQKSPPGGCIGGLERFIRPFDIYLLCSGVHPIYVPGNIFLKGEGKNIVVHDRFKDKLSGAFCFRQSCDRFRRRKIIQPKNSSGNNMNYHSFRDFLKGINSWADRTHFLAVQLNRSISGKCQFLDAQFRGI